MKKCPKCKGTGYLTKTISTNVAEYKRKEFCDKCDGTGKVKNNGKS